MTSPMRKARPARLTVLRVTAVLLLAGIWVLLWDGLTWGQLVAGLGVGAMLLLLLPAPPPGPDRGRLTFRPLPAVRLAGWFAWQFTLSNLAVARAVLFPERHVHPGVVHVPLRSTSPALAAMVANITALTPGMQPVDARPDGAGIDIHVLSLRSVEEIRQLTFHLEDLVLAAFDRDESTASAGRSAS